MFHHRHMPLNSTPAKRRHRDETRELMLRAGRDVLLESGVSVGASTFRYVDAFELLAERGIKVTRGSVHQRIWSSQEAWQLDVIAEFVQRTEITRRSALNDAITNELAALPIETVQQRRHALAEVCRISALEYLGHDLPPLGGLTLPTVMAAWKASSGAIAEHAAVGQHLRQLQHAVTASTIEGTEALTTYLSLAPHPARGLDLSESIRAFAACTVALCHSHAIRRSHDPGITQTVPVRSPDGQIRPWNPLGLGFWMIARGLFTPKPQADPDRPSELHLDERPGREHAGRDDAQDHSDRPAHGRPAPPGGASTEATTGAPRRSREELRQLMIDTGCELLAERGLAFDPPHLTYANAFHLLERTEGITLHRSQVHGRIWDSQEHYRRDVIVSLIDDTATPGATEVDQLVKDLHSPQQSARIRTLTEGWVAASAEASLVSADVDARFDLLVAAQALSTSGATAPEIIEAARTNVLRRTAHNEERYETVARNLGVTISTEFGMHPADAWSTFARTSSALLEGLRLTEPIDPELMAPFGVTDSEGQPQRRNAATLGLCLIIEQLIGLDDDRPTG